MTCWPQEEFATQSVRLRTAVAMSPRPKLRPQWASMRDDVSLTPFSAGGRYAATVTLIVRLVAGR